MQAKIEHQKIGRPAKLGYGAKLNAAKTEGGLLSSLVTLEWIFKHYPHLRGSGGRQYLFGRRRRDYPAAFDRAIT